MAISNVIITMCVGAALLLGVAITFTHRMAAGRGAGDSMAAIASPPAKGAGLAPLPRWDDKTRTKSCLGCELRPGGLDQ